ncbi:MAG: phage major capsid protein [bacterium]|nr:phage major capsid protein [bacterium]
MPDIDDVLDDVQREVKRFGDDVATLKTSMEKDLKAVRVLAEEAGKSADEDGQVRHDLEALTAGVAEKHAAIENQVKEIEDKAVKAADDRLDEIEKKVNRLKLTGGGTDEEFKSARAFAEVKTALNKSRKPGEALCDDAVDVEEFKAYDAAFNRMIRNRQGENGLSAEEAKAASVGSDPDGGYLVTPDVSARTMTIVRESSPIRSIATVETISSDSLEIPIDEDEAAAQWEGETEATGTTGTPQVGVQGIPANELRAKPKATQKFIEDAGIDVPAWLGRKLGERFGRAEATGFVTGDGVKKPRGFLTYPAGLTRGSIEQVTSGAATNVSFDGLITLTTALKGAYKANANFLMKRTTVGAVMLLKDGNGQYLWRPNNQAGQPSMLLGYPVQEAEDMATVGAGALAIAFGDFRAGYTIVDRLGISVLVDPYSAKPFIEFYTRRRVGGDVTNFEAIKLQKIAAS